MNSVEKVLAELREPVQEKPGRCADCGEDSRLRGKLVHDWVCPWCYHDIERPSENGEVDPKDIDPVSIESAVVECLDRADEPLTVEEVARQTGWSREKVSEVTREMRKDDVLDSEMFEGDTIKAHHSKKIRLKPGEEFPR